jgi:hypothetical protein
VTAEIAIVNKNAVALAADSAVTLTVGGAKKIYRSADKIFELTTYNPIALMFFNNLEFMEIPIDVLVKDFRSTDGNREFDTVVDCAKVFLGYLRTAYPFPRETSDRHVTRILIEAFQAVDASMEEKIRLHFQAGAKSMPDLHAIFLLCVQERIDQLVPMPAARCFEQKGPLDIINSHDGSFVEAYKGSFPHYPLDNNDIFLLRALGGLVLHREVFSGSMTGLVLAGFGKNELFPSLIAFDCEGIIAGKLKIRITKYIDIDRRAPHASNGAWKSVDIIPFAQTDMAERFLVGIDSDFEDKIVNTIEEMNRGVAGTLAGVIGPKSKSRKKKLEQTIHSILEATFNHFKSDALQSIKAAKKRQIENMAMFMPKQELAFLAESMINLTSIKRRVSAEEETVAGPIDVAVISRNEGLVWVKRKHYFDPALNPRYFHRLAKRSGASSGGP